MNIQSDDQREKLIEELQRIHDEGEWHARRGVEQDYRCIYCGDDYLASYDAFRAAEFDHLYPMSAGGEDSYDNRVVCCRTCNLLKSVYVPTGNTREERIADAKRFVRSRRAYQEERVARIRLLVRGTIDRIGLNEPIANA